MIDPVLGGSLAVGGMMFLSSTAGTVLTALVEKRRLDAQLQMMERAAESNKEVTRQRGLRAIDKELNSLDQQKLGLAMNFSTGELQSLADFASMAVNKPSSSEQDLQLDMQRAALTEGMANATSRKSTPLDNFDPGFGTPQFAMRMWDKHVAMGRPELNSGSVLAGIPPTDDVFGARSDYDPFTTGQDPILALAGAPETV